MAPRRLSDSEKQELVGRYKAGESTAALAESFGCSANTVSRTVKALLPAEAYAALKASRQKSRAPVAGSDASKAQLDHPPVVEEAVATAVDGSDETGIEPTEPTVKTAATTPVEEDGEADDNPGSLALDDADDFSEDPEEDSDGEDSATLDQEIFHELVPLTDGCDFSDRRSIEPLPLRPGVLPSSVYMLVDKVVELDAKPLKQFPDLGPLDDEELERHGLCLFSSPRTAKRQCGRSQRVIKVPDTAVFERTSSYLLARGITRLVMEGTLIAIDL